MLRGRSELDETITQECQGVLMIGRTLQGVVALDNHSWLALNVSYMTIH
jgi:hypothetical protein